MGLFHCLITLSGTNLSPFAFHDSSGISQFSRDLTEKLNCADVKMDVMSKKAKEILHFTGGIFIPRG